MYMYMCMYIYYTVVYMCVCMCRREAERERVWVYHWTIYQYWVSDKEDGCVVAHQVPGALLCVKLDCKPTRISDRVSTT